MAPARRCDWASYSTAPAGADDGAGQVRRASALVSRVKNLGAPRADSNLSEARRKKSVSLRPTTCMKPLEHTQPHSRLRDQSPN